MKPFLPANQEFTCKFLRNNSHFSVPPLRSLHSLSLLFNAYSLFPSFPIHTYHYYCLLRLPTSLSFFLYFFLSLSFFTFPLFLSLPPSPLLLTFKLFNFSITPLCLILQFFSPSHALPHFSFSLSSLLLHYNFPSSLSLFFFITLLLSLCFPREFLSLFVTTLITPSTYLFTYPSFLSLSPSLSQHILLPSLFLSLHLSNFLFVSPS